ncbi:ATPase, T2SS/T4P/T4SS family [uncultured Desulfuromonas sp.]|uniref:ATPase, T2SS/T4P/T4SS family n=1 Tax=uncultured Desulfuromonas sp. TaxID=181013 RepID=UPI0026147B01|nr:ATPase, T2SS/T4P/T4SS family [uncultured Desulfuromonas sp.]
MSKFASLFRSAVGDQAKTETSPEAPQASDEGDSSVPQNGFTLLFVDDEAGVLKALKRIFLDENYQILTATNGDEALQILERQRVHLLVSDHRMPGMTGAQLLKEVKERWPATIRIMLTGYADVQSIMGAVNEGAVYKFITKPWHDEDLRLTVSLGLQQYVLIEENKKLKEVTRKQQAKIKNFSTLVGENRAVLGSILAKTGVVTKGDYHRALRERQEREFVIDTLVRLGLASESKIVRALQDQLHLEFVDLMEVGLNPEIVRFLPRNLCEKSRLIPIKLEGRHMTLAMADPSDLYKCDNISLMTGFRVNAVIARSSDILEQLNLVYGDDQLDNGIDFDEISEVDPIDEVDIVIEEDEADVNIQELIQSSEVPPIIRIVNAIISEAVRYRASDIHIEPKTKYTVVRFRIDGLLQDKIKIPADLHPAAISRIKILAKQDISERRKPQDGRITVKSGTRLVDLRVSTMPSISGEKVVLRILDKSAAIKKLDELGLLEEDLKKIYSVIKKPQGMFIATGPTGSGKTTMLYSILGEMLHRSKNFETIEDPVEYFLEEANQVHVKEKIGLSFASVLRATLRQDPDVILVGEVRDQDTADVAFKAALTGHMVLTSLHTNSSIASITRLIDIGMKPYLIASALEGIIAQRLVRRLCEGCKVVDMPSPDHLELLRIPAEGLGEVFRPLGCHRCNHTGYQGRTGIYELFVMNEDFRHLICENYRESELLDMARAHGMKTLVQDGLEKVKQGMTSLEELLRVIGPQIRHERVCEHCHRTIDAKFLFCPYCGVFKQNLCSNCKVPMEDDWNICAFCGHKRNLGLAPIGKVRES